MPALKSVKSILIITIIALFITTLLQATRDYIFNLNYIEKYLDTLDYIPITGGYYGYHADNTLPWGISKIFLDDVPIFSELARNYLFGFKGAAVLDRPPFLWLRTLPILKFFGDSHFTYQRFLTVMMTIYYPTIYILVKKILNKKVAILVTLITLINITLTYQVNNVEIYYKYIALIPLFLSLYLIINNTSIKKYIIGGFLLVVSYLIHPIAAVITPTIFIVYIFTNYNFKDFSFKKIIQKKFIINGLLYFLPIVLAFISWNLFTSWYIENHSPPEQVNENLYLEKLVEVNNKTVQNKIFNILNIFIPDILFRSVDPNHSPFFNFYLKFFRFSIISALSPLVFVFMFILGKKSFKLDRQTKLVLFVCGIFPIISFVLLLNPYSFGGYALLYPFCLPFLLAYALYLIQQTSKRTRLILYSSYIIYMIFPLIVISGIFTKIRYINPYIDLFKFILIAIYALISFYIIRFSMKS